MIAGTHSGCGKSTVAMGLNRLLSRRGMALQPWKCGPDYIDPGFHTAAAGRTCRNLDTRLMPESAVKELFSHHGKKADLSLVEGVMGYYDGDGGRRDEGSSYHLAKTLGLPVFLVLDVRSMAQSAGALASGYLNHRSDTTVAGFILNRTGSARHEGMVRDAVEAATGLPVIGCVPRQKDIALPERHLGLVLAEEQMDPLMSALDRMADLLDEHLDMDKLLSLSTVESRGDAEEAGEGGGLYGRSPRPSVPAEKKPRIAVARDEAFAFYYQDNLDLLEDRGAELVEFSPLTADRLPEGCRALYFGGGYPERFAEALSGNASLLDELRREAEAGMPIYGECGGYMYLAESLRDADGNLWPMAGLLPGRITMTSGLRALGYGDVRWEKDSFLAPAGTVVPGHLFHWSALEEPACEEELFTMDRRDSILKEGFMRKNVLASYIHFHFASRPEMAEAFVAAASDYDASKND